MVDKRVGMPLQGILDNSDRAFYKELLKVFEASDVILEVLDAQNPLGTCSFNMENMIKKAIIVGVIGLPNVGKRE
ncbi:unnamed protein product [Lupinus luteus]|uniref:Uncharacterized protein n=1 Tax=Lupinus luteus TaxID=3873 RepID=A0AAV1VUB9_LUPLU